MSQDWPQRIVKILRRPADTPFVDLAGATFRNIADHVSDGVYVVDRMKRICYWNASAERLSGFTAAEAVGQRCRDNMLRHLDEDGEVLCDDRCPLTATMRDGIPRERRVWMRHKKGHRQPVWVRSSPIRDEAGEIVGCVEFFSDDSVVNQVKERLAELEPLALHDPLTGLGNRRYLEEQVDLRMSRYRDTGNGFGVLMIDIDHFKTVNDRHGHDAGDLALQMVARTLAFGLGPHDVIARFGGEEFVVLCDASGDEQLARLAERERRLVSESRFVACRTAIPLTVSIGGVLATPGDTVGTIIPRADAQLYEAKESGRNRCHLEAA